MDRFRWVTSTQILLWQHFPQPFTSSANRVTWFERRVTSQWRAMLMATGYSMAKHSIKKTTVSVRFRIKLKLFYTSRSILLYSSHLYILCCNLSAVKCAQPPNVLNSFVFGTNHVLGYNLTYRCRHGYHFQHGVTTLVVSCDETGRWSEEPSDCRRNYFYKKL